MMASHEAPLCASAWHPITSWLLATGAAMKSVQVLMRALLCKSGWINNQSSSSISGTGPVTRSNNGSELVQKRWRLAISILARTVWKRPTMLLAQNTIRSLASAHNRHDKIVMDQESPATTVASISAVTPLKASRRR